jgi:hypothetical protein
VRSANQAGEPQRHSRARASRGIPLHLSLGTSQPEIAARARARRAPCARARRGLTIKPCCCPSQILCFGAAPFGCVLRSQCCSPWCWVSSTHAQHHIQQYCAAIHARPGLPVLATTAAFTHGTQCARSGPTAATVAPEMIIHLHLDRDLRREQHLLLDPLWPRIRYYCAAIHAHGPISIHFITHRSTSTTANVTTAARALGPHCAHSEPTASTVAPVLLFLHLRGVRAQVRWLRPPRPHSTDALIAAAGC